MRMIVYRKDYKQQKVDQSIMSGVKYVDTVVIQWNCIVTIDRKLINYKISLSAIWFGA